MIDLIGLYPPLDEPVVVGGSTPGEHVDRHLVLAQSSAILY